MLLFGSASKAKAPRAFCKLNRTGCARWRGQKGEAERILLMLLISTRSLGRIFSFTFHLLLLPLAPLVDINILNSARNAPARQGLPIQISLSGAEAI